MRLQKWIGALCVLTVFFCMAFTISKWTEARGVNDDICYLRQAHLFQRFGLGGFDTDIRHDDDGYLVAKLAEIGVHTAAGGNAPCHNLMASTGRVVMQYPPGVGFLLALFPAGHQAVGLYIASCLAILAVGLAAIMGAQNAFSITLATTASALSLYLMNNPMKSSYSLPPTVVVCIAIGFLTARLFRSTSSRRPLAIAAGLGLLFGLAVDFRIANVFLALSYFALLGLTALFEMTAARVARAIIFGLSFVVGVLPTLAANAINAGSPLTTTYTPDDASAPVFGLLPVLKQVQNYAGGTQGILLLLALVGIYAVAQMRDTRAQALFVGAGLLVNLAYFLTHAIFTPYYLVPSAMLSLWTLFFVVYLRPAKVTPAETWRIANDPSLSLVV